MCAIVGEPHAGWGENLKIRRYLASGWLKAVFPLHNRVESHKLAVKWDVFPLRNIHLPLNEFKEYYGEKIGLYFVFMKHYTEFLCIPALVGVPLQIAVFALNDYSAVFLPFYAFFVALWAVTMLEFWKRKEKYQSLQWGTLNFEATELDRADFKGKLITSFIDGSQIKYFPTPTRAWYMTQSFLAIAALILLVVGVVVSIYIIRYTIQGKTRSLKVRVVVYCSISLI